MVEILASQVVSGLATGCVYALVALGFVLIYKATDVVNFAQGEFVMASGFISYTLLIWYGLPYWLVFCRHHPVVGPHGSGPGAGGGAADYVGPDLQHRHRHHRRLDRHALGRRHRLWL